MISAASIKISVNINPTPDDHFAAGPHCCVIRSASGRVGSARWSPRVIGARRRQLRAVSAAGVQRADEILSAPDDHLAASPHCRVTSAASGRAGGAGGCPAVGAGIIPAASIISAASAVVHSAPNDHFAAGPDCRVKGSCRGRADGAGGCPTVGAGIISPTGVQTDGSATNSAPDDHFTASPHCRVIRSRSRRVVGAGGCPTVSAGIVFAASVEIISAIPSAPDDHFAAGPHCCVKLSGGGRVGGAGRCPTIRARVVSAAGVQSGHGEGAVMSGPDDHFDPGPNCRVI